MKTYQRGNVKIVVTGDKSPIDLDEIAAWPCFRTGEWLLKIFGTARVAVVKLK